MNPAGAQLAPSAATLPFPGPLHDMAASDPLRALEAVRQLREAMNDAEALAVAVARSQGRPWRAIAAPLGQPFRTVHRHFRHLDHGRAAA